MSPYTFSLWSIIIVTLKHRYLKEITKELITFSQKIFIFTKKKGGVRTRKKGLYGPLLLFVGPVRGFVHGGPTFVTRSLKSLVERSSSPLPSSHLTKRQSPLNRSSEPSPVRPDTQKSLPLTWWFLPSTGENKQMNSGDLGGKGIGVNLKLSEIGSEKMWITIWTDLLYQTLWSGIWTSSDVVVVNTLIFLSLK